MVKRAVRKVDNQISEKTKLTISFATIIILIGFIIASTAGTITWKNEIDNCLDNQKIINEEMKIKQSSFDEKQKQQDTIFVQIQTDLKWIRATLEELKRK